MIAKRRRLIRQYYGAAEMLAWYRQAYPVVPPPKPIPPPLRLMKEGEIPGEKTGMIWIIEALSWFTGRRPMSMTTIHALERIPTVDQRGIVNGWIVPIWRADSGDPVAQVYLTVVAPGKAKGPHLHRKRTGRFTCVAGNVEIVLRNGDGYHMEKIGEDEGYATVAVPPGTAAEIRCLGDRPAYVLNMPDPAWSAEDPDEWPVTDWMPPCPVLVGRLGSGNL